LSLPVVGEKDARQIGMVREGDAEEIESLPFVPVGGGPNLADGRDALAVREPDLQAQPVSVRDRVEVVVDLEALPSRGKVDGAQVGEEIEPDSGVLA